MIVTIDLFSALTDSRSGGSRVLGEQARRRGLPQTGTELYDAWDRHNKELQRTAVPPATFHDLSLEALRRTYAGLGLPEHEADADLGVIEESVADWPLWPDVAAGLAAVAGLDTVAGVGILSNVDDALVARTRAYSLVDPRLVLTSQRLGAYKPSPAIYRGAAAVVAPERLVHVAASARDVRGSLEAGLATIRLGRPGHAVDPDGPRPVLEVDDAGRLPAALAAL